MSGRDGKRSFAFGSSFTRDTTSPTIPALARSLTLGLGAEFFFRSTSPVDTDTDAPSNVDLAVSGQRINAPAFRPIPVGGILTSYQSVNSHTTSQSLAATHKATVPRQPHHATRRVPQGSVLLPAINKTNISARRSHREDVYESFTAPQLQPVIGEQPASVRRAARRQKPTTSVQLPTRNVATQSAVELPPINCKRVMETALPSLDTRPVRRSRNQNTTQQPSLLPAQLNNPQPSLGNSLLPLNNTANHRSIHGINLTSEVGGELRGQRIINNRASRSVKDIKAVNYTRVGNRDGGTRITPKQSDWLDTSSPNDGYSVNGASIPGASRHQRPINMAIRYDNYHNEGPRQPSGLLPPISNSDYLVNGQGYQPHHNEPRGRRRQ